MQCHRGGAFENLVNEYDESKVVPTRTEGFSCCTEGGSRLGDDALQGSAIDQAVLPVRGQVSQLGPDKVIAGRLQGLGSPTACICIRVAGHRTATACTRASLTFGENHH